MRILQVIPSLAPGFGGPTNAALGLSSALAKSGQEVVIFTTDAGIKGKLARGAAGELSLNRNLKISYFPVQYPRHFKFSLPLAKTLKKEINGFDIIHIHSLFQFSTLAAAYYSRLFRKPYLISPIGQMDPFLLRRHSLRKRIYMHFFERKNIESAWGVHFTSEEERRLALELNLKIKDIVVGLGLDPDEFSNLPGYGEFRSRYPALRNKKIILFLSRINFKKGLDILVKAFGFLARERDDLCLVIAGPDDEGYGRRVKNWLKREGVLTKVIFTGMLLGQDRLAAFRDSDIFVLPSYGENFGLAVIEAMASGLAVIISNRVNISSYIKDAGAGLIVDTDPQQLFLAIKRLIDQPGLRKDIAVKAQALVQERFTWGVVVPDLIRVYESMLVNPLGNQDRFLKDKRTVH